MENKKDPMEQIILEDIQMQAEKIKKEIQEEHIEKMSPEVKDRIRQRIHEELAEREKERIYAKLSEEDRKALELGREMLKKQESGECEEKVVHFRKRKKVYAALAAVVVLVLAMGVTSVGGPKRIVQMMKVMIGEREIVRVETDESNYVGTHEKEDKAYEKVKDVFGVEPVVLEYWPDGTNFSSAEIDDDLQTATLIYDVRGEYIYYHISTHFTDSSWGIDVEDHVVNSYYVEHDKKGVIKINEYETEESGTKSFSASYSHNGLEYVLIGVMDRSDFEDLVKNINFF